MTFKVPNTFAAQAGPIPLSELDANFTAVATRFAMSVSPKDYGATGNGVADDTAAIQSAVTAAVAGGFSVDFGGADYVINGTVSVGAGTVSWVASVATSITLGPSGAIKFTANDTEVFMRGLSFVSNSASSILTFLAAGGCFSDINTCRFFSNDASKASALITMTGVFGSFSDCQFRAGTGNQDCVCINASSANFTFANCSSDGQQARSFAYLDGSGSDFGVQGIRFVNCLLLNYNNGIIAFSGSAGCLDSVIISGCMIDSMQIPIAFTGVLNANFSGSYFGGNSTTITPINLDNCSRLTMTGCTVCQYQPPYSGDVWINGGSGHSYLGNAFQIGDGLDNPPYTAWYNAGSVLPTGMTAVGNRGTTADSLQANPTQFDCSTTVATTAFVAGAGKLFAGQKILGGSATLLPSYTGTMLVVDAAAPATLTLPLATSGPAFRVSLFIYNWGPALVTLASQGGEAIRTSNLTVAENGYVELTNNPGGNAWMVINRGTS